MCVVWQIDLKNKGIQLFQTHFDNINYSFSM